MNRKKWYNSSLRGEGTAAPQVRSTALPPSPRGEGRGQGQCASNFFFDLALHQTSYVYGRNGKNMECQPPSPWPSPSGEGTAAESPLLLGGDGTAARRVISQDTAATNRSPQE